jgi:hypothetical protein
MLSRCISEEEPEADVSGHPPPGARLLPRDEDVAEPVVQLLVEHLRRPRVRKGGALDREDLVEVHPGIASDHQIAAASLGHHQTAST